MKNIAIILAGGTGSRMGGSMPKQFLEIEGKTVIEHPVDMFDSHPKIDEVAVVMHPDWRQKMESLVERSHWTKVTKIIDGGSERYLSSLNAIMSYVDCPDDTNLIFHDAARPYVTTDIIDRVLTTLSQYEAVGVGIPSTDTVWEVRNELSNTHISELSRFIARIPERRIMWLAQTPQAFRLPLIRDAYQRALQDNRFSTTDDCGVVRRYMPEVKIAVVEGSPQNSKITYPKDLGL